MSTMIFYEKPGCLTNRKQKALLQAAGFTLEIRDLLSYPWTAQELMGYLQSLPVWQWFNPAAPALKSEAIKPQQLNAEQAIKLLLEEPLLIRRPLLQWQGKRMAGFDPDRLYRELGIHLPAESETIDQCSRTATAGVCP